MACSTSCNVADEGSTGAGAAATQPPALHVLRALPLLVFEHQPILVDKNENTMTTAHDEEDEYDCEMLMYSISEGRSVHSEERLPEIISTKDRMCYTTPQGWIFIMHGAAPWETWLWSPLTGETIPLPPIQDDHYIPVNGSCLLTHGSPSHPDCAVVLLNIGEPDMWFCRISGGSDRRWGQHTYDIGEYIPHYPDDAPPRKFPIPIIAALGGKLHFVFSDSEANHDKIGVVHLDFSRPSPVAELETLEDVDARTVFPQGMCSGEPWLVESQGELFHVLVCFWEFDPDNIGAVLVHKMDFEDRRWLRVHDIGDRVFLLPDGGNAASCTASACNLRGNRVYFMKNFKEDDANICVYDIEEQLMEIVPRAGPEPVHPVRPHWAPNL
jgi:hypothetical protein